MTLATILVALVFYAVILTAVVMIFRLSRDMGEIKRTLAAIRERLEFPPPR